MKILYLTSRFPFPPIGGDKLRFFNILKYLSRDHKVSIVCFSDHSIETAATEAYRRFYHDLDVVVLPKTKSYIQCFTGLFNQRALQISYYSSGKMKKLIDRKVRSQKYDLILVHLIRMAEYVKDVPVRKILDMTDAQSLNYLRSKSYRAGFWSLVTNAENIMVKKYEQRIWHHFDKTVVVSPVDRDYLLKNEPGMTVGVIPNGVDFERYPYRMNDHNNHVICFIGNMRTAPNTDAIVWFCETILPRVKNRIPDIELYIVGSEPSPRVKALSKIPGVNVTGKVDKIADYVYRSAASIAPMRIGAGIQNKILESMALGTPVVTTSIGLEGIECRAGKEILVADDPESTAGYIEKLIRDVEFRTYISKNAHNFIVNNYRWEKALADLIID